MKSQTIESQQTAKQPSFDNQTPIDSKENAIDQLSQQISSQELDLEIYDQALNSQSTQSSQLNEKCGTLFQYLLGQNESSQELFGSKIRTTPSQSSQSSNLFPSQNSIISSQCPNLSSSQSSSQLRQLSNSSSITNIYMSHSVAYNSLSLNQHSPKSIPSSQTKNYWNLPNSSNEIPLPFETLTPEASQEDDNVSTQATIRNADKQDEVDTDETDEISASDHEDETRLIGNTGLITPNDSGKHFSFLNRHTDSTVINRNKIMTINQNTKLAKSIDQQQNYVAKMRGKCYSYEVNDENKFKSIGKSEEIISKLEAAQGNYTRFSNQQKSVAKSIGKSDRNFVNNYHLVQEFGQPCNIQLPIAQQPMNYSTNNDDSVPFGKIIVQNTGKELGIDLSCDYASNQAQPSNLHIYGNNENVLDLSMGKGLRNNGKHTNEANDVASKEDYMIVDLDDYNLKQKQQPSSEKVRENVNNYRASLDEFYDAKSNQSISNLSRSSTPTSFAPTDEFTEDSNDSATRKRRKKPETSRAKIHKFKNADMKVNAELQSEEDEVTEMRSLSQQLKEASIQSPATINLDDSRFEYYDELNDYYSNKSFNKPSAIERSSNSTQILRNSQYTKSQSTYTRLSNLRDNTLVVESTSLNPNYLEGLDTSVETPKKTALPGPIPKSSNKKTRSSRKSNQKDEQLIRRPPVQRKLKISESTPSQSAHYDFIKRQADKPIIGHQSEQPKNATSKPTEKPRTLSVSSSKSFESANDGDETNDVMKKKKRREQNNDAARNYRMRKKEKEKEMDDKIIALQAEYNRKRKELKKILVQKHSVIKCLLLQQSDDIILPDWMKAKDLKLLI